MVKTECQTLLLESVLRKKIGLGSKSGIARKRFYSESTRGSRTTSGCQKLGEQALRERFGYRSMIIGQDDGYLICKQTFRARCRCELLHCDMKPPCLERSTRLDDVTKWRRRLFFLAPFTCKYLFLRTIKPGDRKNKKTTLIINMKEKNEQTNKKPIKAMVCLWPFILNGQALDFLQREM